MPLKHALALVPITLAATISIAQQGVSKTEILVGTIQDMSGPLAAFGKQARFGMQLRIDELNEQGGVHGRKLKLLLEDSGYDPKKAVLGAQKLVNQDKIFIMAGHVGTAQNNAAMPVQFEKNVINFLPITAARDMYEPYHRLKYSFAVTKYNEDPGVVSIYGYQIIDTFIRAAQKAGPTLTTDSFIKAMDSLTVPPDIFGSAEVTFSATKRLGTDASRLSQIQDGRWRVISEYVKP